jgi:hypothetical protein
MMGEQLGQSEGILPDAAARCHYSLEKLNIAPLTFSRRTSWRLLHTYNPDWADPVKDTLRLPSEA